MWWDEGGHGGRDGGARSDVRGQSDVGGRAAGERKGRSTRQTTEGAEGPATWVEGLREKGRGAPRGKRRREWRAQRRRLSDREAGCDGLGWHRDGDRKNK